MVVWPYMGIMHGRMPKYGYNDGFGTLGGCMNNDGVIITIVIATPTVISHECLRVGTRVGAHEWEQDQE